MRSCWIYIYIYIYIYMSSAVNPPVANLEGVHISSGQPREAAKKKPRETGRKPEGTGRFPEGNRKAARKQNKKLVKHLRPGRFRKVSGSNSGSRSAEGQKQHGKHTRNRKKKPEAKCSKRAEKVSGRFPEGFRKQSREDESRAG